MAKKSTGRAGNETVQKAAQWQREYRARIMRLTPRGRQIIEATATLMNLIHEADWDDLETADEVLREFNDSWLHNNYMADLPGAKHNTLSATDTTTAIREALKTALESL